MEQPAFEIHFTDGRTIKIWSYGKVEGIEGDFYMLNRIPTYGRMMYREALEEKEDMQMSDPTMIEFCRRPDGIHILNAWPPQARINLECFKYFDDFSDIEGGAPGPITRDGSVISFVLVNGSARYRIERMLSDCTCYCTLMDCDQGAMETAAAA